MNISYDRETRAAYVFLVPKEAWPDGKLYNEILDTPRDAPTVLLDIKGGLVVGIEVLECDEPVVAVEVQVRPSRWTRRK